MSLTQRSPLLYENTEFLLGWLENTIKFWNFIVSNFILKVLFSDWKHNFCSQVHWKKIGKLKICKIKNVQIKMTLNLFSFFFHLFVIKFLFAMVYKICILFYTAWHEVPYLIDLLVSRCTLAYFFIIIFMYYLFLLTHFLLVWKTFLEESLLIWNYCLYTPVSYFQFNCILDHTFLPLKTWF